MADLSGQRFPKRNGPPDQRHPSPCRQPSAST